MKKKLLVIAGLALLLSSCKKEGCTDENATNYDINAEVDDGSCILPEPDVRDPYLGNYWVTDSLWIFESFNTEENYTLNISTGGTVSDTIYLNNLWNDGANYFAILSGSNFSIPSQEVSGPYWASGSGNFSGDVIKYETSGDAYINRGSGSKE